jgi:hypothetical protein
LTYFIRRRKGVFAFSLMVEFLGSYCEVPLEDEEFVFEEDRSPLKSCSQIVNEASLNLESDTDLGDVSIAVRQFDIFDDEYLSSRPATRPRRRSFSQKRPLLKRISSSTSAPGIAEATCHSTDERHDCDIPLFGDAEDGEFAPVSVCSISNFGEQPSMVSVQLFAGEDKRLARLQQLSKLPSAHSTDQGNPSLPQRGRLFGSSRRRTPGPPHPRGRDLNEKPHIKGSRNIFNVFKKRDEFTTPDRRESQSPSSINSPLSSRSTPNSAG